MHKNAEIIGRAYQAFNTADVQTLTELFDENASWHTPGRGSIAGDRVGRGAVFAQFGRYGGETGGTFKAELRHVLADDEGRVVGIHDNSGVRNANDWMLTAASYSRSVLAGSPVVVSTSTTFMRGSGSGRRQATVRCADALAPEKYWRE